MAAVSPVFVLVDEMEHSPLSCPWSRFRPRGALPWVAGASVQPRAAALGTPGAGGSPAEAATLLLLASVCV